MALACVSITFAQGQTCGIDTFSPPDSVSFEVSLNECGATSAAILQDIGLENCPNVRLIPSGPYSPNQTYSIYVYDELEDRIYDPFILDVVAQSLSGAQGVQVDSAGVFIEILLGGGECVATKKQILDQLNVDTDPLTRSNIHFYSGTSRITEFMIGDTVFIDSLACKESAFYENLKLLFRPEAPTVKNSLVFNIYMIRHDTNILCI